MITTTPTGLRIERVMLCDPARMDGINLHAAVYRLLTARGYLRTVHTSMPGIRGAYRFYGWVDGKACWLADLYPNGALDLRAPPADEARDPMEGPAWVGEEES